VRRQSTLKRRRKPRDIAQSIIHDRLEYIVETLKLGHPITEDESAFALAAYKAFGEADQIDAEVAHLESLTPEQSNKLDDLLAELEEETKASDN